MGAYLCIARNGVQPAASKRIILNVDCKYNTPGPGVNILAKKNFRVGSPMSWEVTVKISGLKDHFVSYIQRTVYNSPLVTRAKWDDKNSHISAPGGPTDLKFSL